MTEAKSIVESFDEVKIYKPKPVRLCPPSRKNLKSSLSSSTSTVNSEINMNQFSSDGKKIDLENISLEEINTDFFLFGQLVEEEKCLNELYEIINNSGENENEKEESEKNDIPKIERCENPLKKELEFIHNSFFEELMNNFNDIGLNEIEQKEE